MWNDNFRKSGVILNRLLAMTAPDILENQKNCFFMLHRLILKVENFQLPTPKRFNTVVKNILGSIMPPKCQTGFNPIQARVSLPIKGPGGSLGTPMISRTIKASPMKLCTVIVLVKAYRNTEKDFQNYDL